MWMRWGTRKRVEEKRGVEMRKEETPKGGKESGKNIFPRASLTHAGELAGEEARTRKTKCHYECHAHETHLTFCGISDWFFVGGIVVDG
uniref:Uncharacterized protein n=1 Tax=Vespula pensylvanica TaxID=30213 RepID=A0A834U3U3_VESPE|nr:hypothetical protein H0235_012013 [Vespula pensylvanica]